MALFIRTPQVGPAVQFYTLGQHKSVLIAGLGNIGREFENTRHNTGFMCIDAFADKTPGMTDWIEKKDLKCCLSKGVLGGTQVVAIKPATLMNHSGTAVQAVCHYYKIPTENLVVVHDELDIPFGQIRMRSGGGSAGHNGIKSVIETVGENFGRIRIGIGPKKPDEIDSADFVLQKFNPDQQPELPQMAREVTAILTEYLYSAHLPHETRSFLS